MINRDNVPVLVEAALILLIVFAAAGIGVGAYLHSGQRATKAIWLEEKQALTAQAASLDQENRTLRDRVGTLEARLAEGERTGGDLAERKATLDALQKDIENLSKQRDHVKEAVKVANAEAEKQRRDVQALDSERKDKQARLKALTEEIGRRESETGRSSIALRAEIDELTNRRYRAEEAAKGAEASVERIKQTLGTLTDQARTKQDELTALNKDIEVKKSESEEAAAALRAKLSDLESRRQTAAAETKAAEDKARQAKSAMAKIENALTGKQSALATLARDFALKEAEASKASIALAAELDELKNRRAEADQRSKAAESQAERIRQELTALDRTLRTKQANLRSLDAAIRQRQTTLREKPAAPPAQPRVPVQDFDQRVCLEAWARIVAEPESRAKLAELRASIAAAQSELDTLNDRRQSAERQTKAAEGELQRLQNELKSLRQKLRDDRSTLRTPTTKTEHGSGTSETPRAAQIHPTGHAQRAAGPVPGACLH
ncbi:MAG: hypothetical protein MJE12_02350 [Alphaproteobacteria bacterium]|nr:hypothetical protein [Alphaproteobacteria bacterium]